MKCRHVRKGIITNQPTEYDASRTHFSSCVCDRPECIRAVAGECAAFTLEKPYLIPDATRVPQEVTT